mgnify:FL=1|jgi:uncharacterized protein YlxW (UPF0749 family)
MKQINFPKNDLKSAVNQSKRGRAFLFYTNVVLSVIVMGFLITTCFQQGNAPLSFWPLSIGLAIIVGWISSEYQKQEKRYILPLSRFNVLPTERELVEYFQTKKQNLDKKIEKSEKELLRLKAENDETIEFINKLPADLPKKKIQKPYLVT